MTAVQPVPRQTSAVEISLLLVRVIVGFIFAMHGAQKLFGVFGGPGLQAMIKMMGPVLGVLVTVGEFFGGLGLIFGFLSRFSAASLIVIMLGAIFMYHGKNGFFLQMDMRQSGFEYNLALIGLLLPTLIAGPGPYSFGQYLPLPRSRRTGRPIAALE
jgi:putative oxidoreductase